MAIKVVEFSSGGGGYKIRKIFAYLRINTLKGNYRILRIRLMGGVKKSQNLTFKVNFLCQKLSESFSIFLFIEEYQFRSTFFVIDFFR